MSRGGSRERPVRRARSSCAWSICYSTSFRLYRKTNRPSRERLEPWHHAAGEAFHVAAGEVGGQGAELAHHEQVAEAHLAPVALERLRHGLGAAADEQAELDRR